MRFLVFFIGGAVVGGLTTRLMRRYFPIAEAYTGPLVPVLATALILWVGSKFGLVEFWGEVMK